MKRALVTGGCGFIGSSLTKELIRLGWEVDIVDDMSNGHLELLEGVKMRVIPGDLLGAFYAGNTEREKDVVHIIQSDFSHRGVLKNIVDEKYDCVFHQAAVPRVLYSVENPSETTDTNLSSTVRLLEACISNVDRVVFASSSSVYGGADTLPTKESSVKDPKSPYAWQKSATEDIAKIFGNLYNLDIVCLRYFNVFGPGQYGDSPYSTAVSAWCNAIVNNSHLRSDGDGSQSRDLCYIDNVVQANILAATSSKKFFGKSYNVACGDRTSNADILDYLIKRFPGIVIDHAPWRPGDVKHTQADISSSKEDLGYDPKVKFWEGLEKTLEWWGIE